METPPLNYWSDLRKKSLTKNPLKDPISKEADCDQEGIKKAD